MQDYTLYFAPGTCSRIPFLTLEEAGTIYQTRLVNLAANEHKQPPFRAINPKGKVPALVVDGTALTENVAILHYLAKFHAGVLPLSGDPVGDTKILADLAWFAGTIHPILTRMRRPAIFAGEPCAPAVQERATHAMAEHFGLIEERLAGKEWFADEHSCLDAYVFWFVGKTTVAGMNLDPYENMRALAERVAERPATHAVLQQEAAALAEMAAEEQPLAPPSAA